MDCWSSPVLVDDEIEKLAIRVHPPRVTIDNSSSPTETLIKVDSANKLGSLLEVVQVLSDMDLAIKRAYISSDGEWFMDVFHVVNRHGRKLTEDGVADRIQHSLGPKGRSFRHLQQSVDFQTTSESTAIELTGKDRPGLLSEVFAVLTNLKCNVAAAEVWTHNSRMASVVYITDVSTKSPVDDDKRLAHIKQLLLYVLMGNGDKITAKAAVSVGFSHKERRLHQMMYADRDYELQEDDSAPLNDRTKPIITAENCVDKAYTVVNLRCLDRSKLLFDTVFTLTDMQYVVYHATVTVEGPIAHQEFYIRHVDGSPVSSEAEMQRLIHCMEAAIKRRTSEGVRLELCSEDRVGLLSDVTRIFRENGLSVKQAKVMTRGTQAVNVFYVGDAFGGVVRSETIEAVRQEIGSTILNVKEDEFASAPKEDEGFSFRRMFRTRSEKILGNLGLIKSCT